MAFLADARFRHVSKIIASQLGVSGAQVEKASNPTWVGEFLAAGADGAEPRMALMFFLQPREGSAEPVLFMTSGDVEPLTGRCAYCVRLSDPMAQLPTNDLENNLNFGTLSGGSPMPTLMTLVSKLYAPLIEQNAFSYTKKMSKENSEMLQASTTAFCTTLEKSIESLEMAMTLPKPEKKWTVEAKPARAPPSITQPRLRHP